MEPILERRSAGLIALLTALAYAAIGWVAVQLAIPPSPAAPLYPSAGLALAAALAFGRPALLGAAVGSFAVNAGLVAQRGALDPLGLVSAALIGLGVALQAGAGRWLVERFVSQPLTLGEPRDLLRFFLLGGPLACLVSAGFAASMLGLTGQLPWAALPDLASTWWLGDTLGVLVAAPIVLTLIGRPRADWAPRRWIVALPMLLAIGLLAAAAVRIVETDRQRAQTVFERDAFGLADRLVAALRDPQDALRALHGLFVAAPALSPEDMRLGTRPWLEAQPYLLAMGYSERIARADLPAFEARVRARGPTPDYRVFDRDDAPADTPAGGPSRYETVAIRYIEPLAANRPALGVNALSIPPARRAIERAAATGEVAATAGFKLTQSEGDETGIVIYQALYDPAVAGQPLDDGQRRQAFRGVVFVTLQLDAMVQRLLRSAPDYLRWCLVDRDPGALRPRLAGPPGCEATPASGLHLTRATTIGPRVLELRVGADRHAVPGLADGGGLPFVVAGVLATALLGALLLMVSGRQRRIEAAVELRTAELQRAGRALAESEERLRRIVDHVPIGVLYADGDAVLQAANPSLRAMLGVADPAAARRELVQWLHPDDRATAERWIDALAQGDEDLVRGQVRLLRPDGQALTVRLALSALRDGDSGLRRLVGVVEDITERLQLEASELARDAAEAASRTKSEFVGRMSHELRTPLNAMLGFAQLLGRDEGIAPQQRRWTAQIQEAGWHLLNMINDTLDLSMIESGSVRLAPRPLDAAELVRASLDLVAGAAERRQVTLLTPEVAPATPAALGDETRAKQVLTNLLSNAVKYNRPGGTVAVRVGPCPAGVEFEVSDTGLGLTPSQAEALFQPFNRLGRESTAIEGSGIGLVISRRLVELMGGSLVLRSASPAGSTFVVVLPAAAPAPETEAAVDADASGRYRKRRVHYVEDNETNVVLMQAMLAKRPQIELSVSRLGLDGLVAVREQRPDLILLDMHLPDIDGLDLLQHLKKDAETAAIPVLVVSADATPERVERALAEGAASYLTKPIDLAALLAAVDEVLEHADTRWG